MPSTLDHDAIEAIRALGGDDPNSFLREIIDIFLSDTPARIDELAAAITSGDTPAFLRAAHSIKGSSANVGAAALKTAAEELENAARATGIAAQAPGVARIREEFERTKQALMALLAAS